MCRADHIFLVVLHRPTLMCRADHIFFFFFFFLINQENQIFFPKLFFSKFQSMKLNQREKKKYYFSYNIPDKHFCCVPFELLKILVFDFTLSFELQNHKICKKKNFKRQTNKQKQIQPTDPVFFQTLEYNQPIIFLAL